MKRIITMILTIIIASALAVSCGRSRSKDVVKEFRKLVETVEKEKGDLTAEEWRDVAADFEERFAELGIEDINEEDFSVMQKIELTALVVRWQAVMVESMPSLLESAIKEETGMSSEEIGEAVEKELGDFSAILESSEYKEQVEELKKLFGR